MGNARNLLKSPSHKKKCFQSIMAQSTRSLNAITRLSKSSWTSLIWQLGRRSTESTPKLKSSSLRVDTKTSRRLLKLEVGWKTKIRILPASISNGPSKLKISTTTLYAMTKSWTTSPQQLLLLLKLDSLTVCRTWYGSILLISTLSTLDAMIADCKKS